MLLQGRYKVVRELGRGGTGAVYLCHDQRLPGSVWAVKELLHVAAVSDFEQEARVLASLKHQGLPVVVDFFVENGRYYLVQEYMEGLTFAEYVAQHGPVHERLALEWGLELAEILEYLHSQNPPVLHNDVKPHNVVVRNSGLKLIDFGLARRSNEAAPPSGSLSYAPPEQWEGSVSPASDLYSWGATLYFLLTGIPPSPLPGEHRLRGRRPELAPETEELVLQCLAQEPSKRPASASLLVNHLQYLLARLPVPNQTYRYYAKEESFPTPEAPSRRRARGMLAAVVIGLLILVVTAHLNWERPVALPPTPFALPGGLLRANQLVKQQQYGEARKLLAQTLKSDPENALAIVLDNNARFLESNPKALRVETLVPAQGEYHEPAEWMLQGMALAQQDEPTVYQVWDYQSQPSLLLDLVRDLSKSKYANVILGPFGSQNLLLVAPLCNVAQLPVLAPSANDPRIAEAGQYVHAVGHSQRNRVQVLLAELQRRKLMRGAIFHQEQAVFGSTAELAERAAHSWGATVQKIQYTNEQDLPGFTGGNWDFVFLAENRGTVLGRLVRLFRKRGYTGVIATMGHIGSQDFLKHAGVYGEGVLLASPLDPDSEEPRVQNFLKRYRELFPRSGFAPVAAVTYDAATLVAAAERAGNTRSEVQKYLQSIGNGRPLFVGVSGHFRPSLHGLRNLEAQDAQSTSVLFTVEKGRYVKVR